MTQQGEQRRKIAFSYELKPQLFLMMKELAEMKGITVEEYCQDVMFWSVSGYLNSDHDHKWNEEKGIEKNVTFRIVADVEVNLSKGQEECLEYATKQSGDPSIQKYLEHHINSGPRVDADNFESRLGNWVDRFGQRVQAAYEER